jgi:hypothetical protein
VTGDTINPYGEERQCVGGETAPLACSAWECSGCTEAERRLLGKIADNCEPSKKERVWTSSVNSMRRQFIADVIETHVGRVDVFPVVLDLDAR